MFTGRKRQFVIYVITCGCYTYVYVCEVAERRRPRHARAYIRPPAEHPAPHLPRRAAETKGRQGVHPTPCRAPSPAPATQKPPAQRRRPRDAGRTSDPLQCTKPHACHWQSGGDQGTPGRTSDPVQCTKSHLEARGVIST